MPYAQLDDIRLYYEIKARNKEIPLVMVPGLGGDILSFAYSANTISRYCPVVLMENIGVGRSSVPEPPYTTYEMAEHLKKLIDFLGYSKVNLLGHSMGGYITQRFAVRYPSMVEKLILSGTAVKMSEKIKFEFQRLHDERVLSKISMREYYTKTLKALVSKSFFENVGNREAILDLMEYAPYQQTLQGFSGQLSACLSHDSSCEIKNIRAKTLVATGALDEITPPSDSEFIFKQIENSELKLIENVAHLPHLENPNGYTEIILKFIDKAE